MRSIVTPACGSSPERCEVGDALRLVARAHVLDVLHVLARAPARFNALRAETRVNANVLSLRLRDLVEAGLVERRDLGAVPAGVEYEATPRGLALLAAVHPIQEWARVHAGPAVEALASPSAL